MDSLIAVRTTAREDFRVARRHALFASFVDLIRRRPNQLISLDDIRQYVQVRGQRWVGSDVVSINQIVGSEGRYADFDRRFLPRKDTLVHRWSSIDEAWLQEVTLPPVDLYKVGDMYFVRDGNHRISVAKRQGQQFIDARVTELLVNVPLSSNLSVHDLLLKQEYSDFLQQTRLDELRPEQLIEFSELGGYHALLGHIEVHGYFLGKRDVDDVPFATVVTSWFDTVYMPCVLEIREQQVLQHFPGRTEADLYRWIMDHRWYMLQQTGKDPGPSVATMAYVARFGRRSPLQLLKAAALSVKQLWGKLFKKASAL